MTREDVGAMHDDYLNHLVPDATCSTLAPCDWSVEYDYIQWYFRVSHAYMIPNGPEDSHRSAH